jgi:hypothetical protein
MCASLKSGFAVPWEIDESREAAEPCPGWSRNDMSKKRPKLERVRIVRAKGGGPIRTVIQVVRKIPTGDFPSLKAGIALPWEGISERHDLWVCEADWNVRKFMTQPMRMEFHMSDGSVLIYFPDVERVLSDTTIVRDRADSDSQELTPRLDRLGQFGILCFRFPQKTCEQAPVAATVCHEPSFVRSCSTAPRRLARSRVGRVPAHRSPQIRTRTLPVSDSIVKVSPSATAVTLPM